ncbi:MAG: MBL fold metallo-hydrolase [Anaerolineae bacterium]|nr:MBL fold metallo-hydrolase [Anaerolineae bacterium]
MEIAPGIHRIEAPLGDRFVCMYLLVGSQRTLLIDTGLAHMIGEAVVPYMQQLGLNPANLSYVLISHIDFDHTGGCGAVRQIAPNAVFMCHALDRPMIEDVEAMIQGRYSVYVADHGIDESPETKALIRKEAQHVPMDIAVQGGEVLHLGGGWHVEILHTPGHSRGHLSVYDPRSKTMIIIDSVLWNAVLTKEGQPAFPPTYRYVDTYLSTIHRLQGYDLEALATAHYPLYCGKGPIAEFMAESAAFVERVETAVRDELKRANAPLTMQEIIAAISPKLGKWPETAGSALSWPLTGHFERLANFGLVELGRRDGLQTIRWIG